MAKLWYREMLEIILREDRKDQRGKDPEIGDEVLVEDRKKPRLKWRKGRIVRILDSHDLAKRNCEVELAGVNKTIVRAIKDLVVLS